MPGYVAGPVGKVLHGETGSTCSIIRGHDLLAGLGVEWPEEPPDTVEISQRFNVTYHAVVTEDFYMSDSRLFPNQR